MRRGPVLGVVAWLLLAGLCNLAAADENPPAAKPARPDPAPVRAGKTTVTVIDENESVDDVVTRVRAARERENEARAREPAQGAGADGRPGKLRGGALRDAIRDARGAREARGGRGDAVDRRGQPVRERIRDRLNERKNERPRADQLRRQRAH